MGIRRCTAGTIAVTLAGLLFRPLGAAADPVAVRVAYAAAQDCPGGDEFAASIAARGRRVDAVAADSPSAMQATIVAEPAGGYRGELRMGPSDRGEREVRGASCREVVDALALITVSSLGPASTDADDAAKTQQPAVTTTPEATAAEPPRPPAPTTAPAHLEAGNLGAPPKELVVGAGTLRFDRDIAMTAFAGVTTGIIPSVVLPRYDFEVARTNFVTSPEGHSYHLVPTVRLHFGFLGTGEYHSSHGTTEAEGVDFGADICSPLYFDRTGFEVLLCAELMGGYFGVETTSTLGMKGPTKITGFSTAGFGLDLAYNVGRHFHLGLKLGGALVIGDVTAEASDGSEIFKSSTFSLHAMLGAGGNF